MGWSTRAIYKSVTRGERFGPTNCHSPLAPALRPSHNDKHLSQNSLAMSPALGNNNNDTQTPVSPTKSSAQSATTVGSNGKSSGASKGNGKARLTSADVIHLEHEYGAHK